MAPDTHCELSLIFQAPKAAKKPSSLERKPFFFPTLFPPRADTVGGGEAEGVKNLQTAHDYAKEKEALIAGEKNIAFF